ncbi:antitoxin [Clostridium celatum]|uniref:antitoxin n=1 Tax=Clostridium celatum TaxID=36834 RepID=UPI001896E48A|nr:antitoxin [Clostridium celatum]
MGEKTKGRPVGRVKTAKIEIAIEPEIKEEFMRLLGEEGKKASSEIGVWIREYIKSRKEK